jgi:O-antigen/teichoic acid export membrane protein
MGVVKRQSVQSSVATYIGVFIGYVNFIFLFPQFLTPEQFGLTRLLISVSVIFSSLSMMGTPFALLRFFPYFNDKKAGHHGFFTFSLWSSVAGFIFFALLFFIFRSNIQSFFQSKSPLFNTYYNYLFPLSFVMVFFEILFAYMKALLKTVVPTVIREVVLRLLQTAALLFLVLGIVDFNSFLVLFIGSYLIHLVVLFIYIAFLGQLFLFTKIDFKGRASMKLDHALFIFDFCKRHGRVIIQQTSTRSCWLATWDLTVMLFTPLLFLQVRSS